MTNPSNTDEDIVAFNRAVEAFNKEKWAAWHAYEERIQSAREAFSKAVWDARVKE